LGLYRYKLRKLLLHNVLHADDSPHTIALGVGIAVLVAFFPLIGIQTVVAIAIAALFRANKAVCVPIVWITNPATVVPIFYGCFEVGRLVMPVSGAAGEEGVRRLVELARTGSILELSFWTDLFKLLAGLGAELWIGCLIVGTVFSVVSYFLARWGVAAYRERRRRRVLQRNLFRSKLRQGVAVRRSESG
jgi:uncharacterized protein (DUF2062 family)